MLDLSEATLESLGERLAAEGFKPSHAGPLLRRHYGAREEAAVNGHPLPGALAGLVAQAREARMRSVAARTVASDGTVKLLVRGPDGRTVECVLMPGHRSDRAAGCLSSQVGCAMGCDFCATGTLGLERNLSGAEIVDQFLLLRAEALAAGRRLQTVVFMGMGEPLNNLDAVLPAIRRIADNALGGLGWGQVTVSTVGIVPGIDALARSGLGVNLALSLHAPDDATRARLLPAGRRYAVADILAAADRYQAATDRPVSIQYVLLSGINDTPAHAGTLADLLGSRRVHVNVLRYNPTGPGLSGTVYSPSRRETEAAFVRVLGERGVVTHVRESRGPDIAAACGQLHRAGAQAPAS